MEPELGLWAETRQIGEQGQANLDEGYGLVRVPFDEAKKRLHGPIIELTHALPCDAHGDELVAILDFEAERLLLAALGDGFTAAVKGDGTVKLAALGEGT